QGRGVKRMYDFTLPSEFERMYEDYFPKVYNFIFYRLLHKQDTEDLVSEVFLKVARNIFSYNPQKAKFNTWIFTIARNTLTDYFRRRQRTVPLDECDAELTRIDYAEQYEAIEDDERRMVYQALMRLDSSSRQVLALKYFGELSNREISKLTGINESTVSTIALRSRQKMREYLLENVY
ncbi:MAG: RNA polymerase sigma factor, partial [Bacillota bacterium]